MNLKKIQELEQLNIEIEQLSSKVRNEIFALKKRNLNQAASDFEAFFKEQGFSVSERNVKGSYTGNAAERELTANFGKQTVALYLPSHETAWVGSYSVLELHLTGSQKGSYKIIMNPKGASSSFQSSVTMTSAPKSDDEKLERDIKKAQSDLETLKNKVGSYDKMELGFQIFDQQELKQNPRSRYSNTVQYDNMKSLLTAMFES